MTDELVLYHSPFSRSYTAYWMLEELGRPYRVEIVDIRTGAQKRPEFLRLNPMGKVPTLSDGGLVLTERGAICAHLADKYAYGKLAPLRESPERSQYLRWLFFDAGVLEPAMAMRR
ncbi:MAG TPA: glutathione S-transferase N-terminal domain-containing protein, partial [Candidatus Binataceae bacterium]|nr:glutathione S-transferase N-terminal domain-containing protein [Candidatus Binataceae bacterium]